jgi:two-component system, OmpR family, phosphate regulon sensor histidine kinase PhoR
MMPYQNLAGLADLITERQDELLSLWRQAVRGLTGAQDLDTPTINDQVPGLLNNLTEALRRSKGEANGQTSAISAEHGFLRWQAGFDVTEVVAEYNILRGCVQDLAEGNGLVLRGKAAHIVNGLFDEAVGQAVKAFETMMTIELRHRHEEHVAFLVHDLRTPLDAVALAITLLERSLPEKIRSREVESAISVMRGNVERLDDRVRGVLEGEVGLGRSFQPQFTSLNLREQVDELIHDLAPLATLSGATISNHVSPEVAIYSDPQLLGQILQNLLSNALKYTSHGSVVIGGHHVDSDGTVECWVRDTGEGIAANRVERVFERFETDSRPGKRGIGLGLAIVKEIVELHKGEIKVESKLGEGSTFTFVIPNSQSA